MSMLSQVFVLGCRRLHDHAGRPVRRRADRFPALPDAADFARCACWVQIIQQFARAGAAGERIFEILDAESAVQEKPDARPLDSVRGDVNFDHVSFGYDAVSPVLRDVSFEAPAGKVVALLGPTGSGKTTVVNLLPRFYDVTGGAITDRRPRHPRRDAAVAAGNDRHHPAGRVPVLGDDPRQHRLRRRGRHLRGDRRGGEDRAHPRLHHVAAGRLRHLGGRARHHALRRSEAAPLDRPDAAAGPAHPHLRRLHLQRRHADRVPHPAGAGGGDEGPHDVRDRPAAAHGEERRHRSW